MNVKRLLYARKTLLELKIVQFVNRILKIKKRKVLWNVICLLSDQESLKISCIAITHPKFIG